MSMLIDAYRFGGGGGGPQIEVIGSSQGSSASSIAVAMPATVGAGDWLYVFVASHGTVTTTAPMGWTAMGNSGAGASVLWTYAWRRLADGSEGGTSPSFGLSPDNTAVAICVKIPAHMVDTATAPSSGVATGTSGTPDAPGHSPAWGAEDTIWVVWTGIGVGSITSFPYATHNLQVNNADFGAAVCVTQENTATLNPAAFGATGVGAWVARTVAFRPA